LTLTEVSATLSSARPVMVPKSNSAQIKSLSDRRRPRRATPPACRVGLFASPPFLLAAPGCHRASHHVMVSPFLLVVLGPRQDARRAVVPPFLLAVSLGCSLRRGTALPAHRAGASCSPACSPCQAPCCPLLWHHALRATRLLAPIRWPVACEASPPRLTSLRFSLHCKMILARATRWLVV
jgi:hypothetical protein